MAGAAPAERAAEAAAGPKCAEPSRSSARMVATRVSSACCASFLCTCERA